MEDKNWNKFWETGSVNDYLAYKLSKQENSFSSAVSLEKETQNKEIKDNSNNNAERASFNG